MQAFAVENRDSQHGGRRLLVPWQLDFMEKWTGNGSTGSRGSQCSSVRMLTVGNCTHQHCLPGDKLVLGCLLAGTLLSPQKEVSVASSALQGPCQNEKQHQNQQTS